MAVQPGSAIDQIDLMNVITPDLMSESWITDLYNPMASMALTLFSTLLLIAVIAYYFNLFDNAAMATAEMMTSLKRCVVEIPAIVLGLQLFSLMLDGNELLSTAFAGTVNVTGLLVGGLLYPSGLIVFVYAVGGMLTAWFYICRFYILILTVLIWPVGCILRIFDVTRPIGLLIRRVTVINIFLGSWMCLCYATGAWISNVHAGFWVSWGLQMLGLVIMYFALSVPRSLWKSQFGNGLESKAKKTVQYVKMVV